jgi:hypothetical protein
MGSVRVQNIYVREYRTKREVREVGKQGVIAERGRGVEIEPEKKRKRGSSLLFIYTLKKRLAIFRPHLGCH